MVPVEIAVDVDFDESNWYKLINILVDVIFVVDILVNFNTTFEEGYEEVCDRKKIAANYLKTRFTVDFLSAIPVDLIGSLFFSSEAKELKALSLLKLVRMMRLSRIIRALNVQRDLKSKIKLLKVFF